MLIAVTLLAATLQAAQPADPHRGAFTSGLGVDCAHCHRVDDWKSRDQPALAMAVRMSALVKGLSEGTLRPLGGITCVTCHRGAKEPSRLPPESWQSFMASWPKSLVLDEQTAKKPARTVYRNLTVMDGEAGNIRMSMSVFAASLGVGCDFCHVANDWSSDAKPEKRTTRAMLSLFDELPTYFDPAHVPRFQCYTCHQGGTKPQRD